MDPFTALGIAGNIVQFVECGAKLLTLVAEIKRKGQTAEFRSYERIARDLRNLCRELTTSNHLRGEIGPAEEPEAVSDRSYIPCFIADVELWSAQALQRLATDCIADAEGLISKIRQTGATLDQDDDDPTKDDNRDGEKARKKAAMRTMDAFRVAVLQLWNHAAIETMDNRLQKYRSQLGLRLLAVLNSQAKTQGNNIVEVLSVNRSIKSTVETIAAVLTRDDGESQTLLPSVTPLSVRGGHRYAEDLVTYSLPEKTADRDPGSVSVNNQAKFSGIWESIQDALWFRSLNDRKAAVAESHKKTFEWIFADVSADSAPWDSFSDWLSSDEPCYWVNGKAGSGKSTLMKFLWTHHELEAGLRRWSGTAQLLKAGFFIWRAGQPIQRSQEGLLRALLYQAFEQRQELIAVCFPNLTRTLGVPSQFHKSGTRLDITFEELKLAFALLLKNLPAATKLFLLIDGLDEYDGNHRDLIDLCLLAAKHESKHIKVLMSSRPIPACVHAFAGLPRLKLQDLTKGDILKYVNDHLCDDGVMKQLEYSQVGVTEELSESITSKASGVFLWVVLAVRSILTGLENYDRREDLFRRLEVLPPDLEKLYDHLLNSISLEYRQQTSLMLQLLVRATTVQHEHEMTVLQMSFAEEEDTQACLATPVLAIGAHNEERRCKGTEGRMRSRCWGLIESHAFEMIPGVYEKRVAFLHRTVIEYLNRGDTWDNIVGLNPKPQWQLDELLLSSSLSELKCSDPEVVDRAILEMRQSAHKDTRKARFVMTRGMFNIVHGLRYGWAVQQHQEGREMPFIDALRTCFDTSPQLSGLVFQKLVTDTLGSEGVRTDGLAFPDLFLLYAAVHGLGGYLTHSWKADVATPEDYRLILTYLLINLGEAPTGKKVLSDEQRQVQIQQLNESSLAILRSGLDPSTPSLFWDSIETANVPDSVREAVLASPTPTYELSPWMLWLSCGMNSDKSGIVSSEPLVYAEVLEHMLLAGARFDGHLRINGALKPVPAVARDVLAHVSEQLPARRDVLGRIGILIAHAESGVDADAMKNRNKTSRRKSLIKVSSLLRRRTK